jgi:hypothetical protein
MTTATTPDWVKRREGEVQPNSGGQSWLVYFGGEPQYFLAIVPAKGKYACRISQTINGKRLDQLTTYDTPEQAFQGGLEQLREALGW